MVVPFGTTAFFSGAKLWELLSDEEREFAANTKVVYAPRPYIWIEDAKATSDGLAMVSEKKELPLDALPPWEEQKVITLPVGHSTLAKLRITKILDGLEEHFDWRTIFPSAWLLYPKTHYNPSKRGGTNN